MNSVCNDSLCSPYEGGQTWLAGDGLSEEEQLKASKGTLIIPNSQYPPKKVRNDCLYHHSPATVAPSSLANLNACENWLPRRAMSASRIAGIVHTLEGWNVNKCGQKMFDVEQVWEASLKHGFRPLMTPNKSQAVHLRIKFKVEITDPTGSIEVAEQFFGIIAEEMQNKTIDVRTHSKVASKI
ncbi:hypothetical protein Vadar_022798 [Vaccinium darrowii]|uniref:Uncharacterized protein n=1 Tax=Vaccinium darrowii TaxID=229202 RepID=A0ACB7X361_9ERIC|nr:hypothetical protein Vadar_022798 [Vaccinium darrowii]